MLLHLTALLRKRLLPLVSDSLGESVPCAYATGSPCVPPEVPIQSSIGQQHVPLHGDCEPRRAGRYLFDRASLLLLVEDAQEQLRLLSLQEAYHLLVRPSRTSFTGRNTGQ